jgi:hypothetical protein
VSDPDAAGDFNNAANIESHRTSAQVLSGRATLAQYLALTGILALYFSFPTKNYYWDGISFALSIEESDGLSPSLIHPNHLMYNVVGYLLYGTCHAAGFGLRALQVLQISNSIISVLGVCVLLRTLRTLLNSTYLSVTLALLFALSATWWKFSTDANAYVPAVFLLLLSFRLLLPTRTARPVFVSCLHSGAMLLHQLAVLFYPVVLLGLFQQTAHSGTRKRVLTLLQYSLIAGTLTLGAYCHAYHWTRGGLELMPFVKWITTHSSEVSFSFDVPRNLLVTAQGNIKLFLGGRLSFLRDVPRPAALAVVLVLLSFIAAVAFQIVRHSKDLRLMLRKWSRRDLAARHAAMLCVVWALCYLLFLTFWLPRNTFYRLFYLVPLIVLIGVCLARSENTKRGRRFRVAYSVVAIAVSNFAFLIYPLSQTGNNKPLVFAIQMGRVWASNVIIYYGTYNPDNQLVRYFNPHTTWRHFHFDDLQSFEREVAGLEKAGATVWLDTSAGDSLISGSDDSREWFRSHTKRESSYELADGRHRIRFCRISTQT